MDKSPDAFRSIGEVARLVGVAPHVLRYWETQFSQISPVKRSDGRRYYRLDDVLLAAGICESLREEGLTIRGARRLIAQDIHDKEVVRKVMDEVAPKYAERPGGYTRILRVGTRRGDGVTMALIELV